MCLAIESRFVSASTTGSGFEITAHHTNESEPRRLQTSGVTASAHGPCERTMMLRMVRRVSSSFCGTPNSCAAIARCSTLLSLLNQTREQKRMHTNLQQIAASVSTSKHDSCQLLMAVQPRSSKHVGLCLLTALLMQQKGLSAAVSWFKNKSFLPV